MKPPRSVDIKVAFLKCKCDWSKSGNKNIGTSAFYWLKDMRIRLKMARTPISECEVFRLTTVIAGDVIGLNPGKIPR